MSDLESNIQFEDLTIRVPVGSADWVKEKSIVASQNWLETQVRMLSDEEANQMSANLDAVRTENNIQLEEK